MALALLVFITQAHLASKQKSAAFDEQYHLTAGYTYLHTGDYRLATTHPPLMGMIAAAGLWGIGDIVLPLDHPAWESGDRFLFSDVFVWDANANGPDLIVSGRRPLILLGALLVAAIFMWAQGLYGPFGGWIALLLATFSPTLLGQVRVITTDLGITLFLFLAMWRLWRWIEAERWLDLVLFGISAGLTMGAKYNGLLVWPVALLVLLVLPAAGLPTYARRLGGLAIGFVVASVVLWSLYKFDVGAVNIAQWSLVVPAPFYWQQLLKTFVGIVDSNQVQVDYLLGEAGTGWWYYFPVAMVYKLPLSLWLLTLGGFVVLVRRGDVRRLAWVWAPPLPFLVLALTGTLTIGFRHLLPAVPFFILLAAAVTNWQRERRSVRVLTTIVAVLCIWFLVTSIRIFPHHESYFNELAGHWYHWNELLVDSNLDWGQDLPALRDLMADLDVDRVNLAYFGKAVPEKYGVNYHPLPSYLRFVTGRELNAYNPYAPEPGWYAISATSLRLGLRSPETADLYADFRARRPVARAGYSIYLYQVEYPSTISVDRRVLVDVPAMSADPGLVASAPGGRVQVKWMQQGDTEIVPRGRFGSVAEIARFHPVGASFDGIMTLLGFVYEDGAEIDDAERVVVLYWQVGDNPMQMPAPTQGEAISAFVHVTDEDPAHVVAQYDGWDVALRGLEEGDVLIQRALLTLAPDLTDGDYTLRVGLYSPQNWARVPVEVDGAVADHVLLDKWHLE